MIKLRAVLVCGVVGSMALGSALAQSDREALREAVIDRVERPAPELSSDLREMIQSYRSEQEALVQARRELSERLQEVTAAERRAAIEAFQEENAGRLAAQRALGEQIREKLRDVQPLRPDRPSPETVETSSVVVDLMDDFSNARESILSERKRVQEELRGSSPAERQEAMQALREAQKEALETQREKAKQLREERKAERNQRRN
jgi:cytochrome c556